MRKITTFLWFDGRAEEAMNFYTAIFKNSRPLRISRYGDSGPGPKGSVMTAQFTLDGQEFVALNGGPEFKFTPAISFAINCDTQEEIDYFWEKLSEGGEIVECGWLTDKFGLSWQVVPAVLSDLVSGEDPAASERVMAALLKMKKLDLALLRKAFEGG